MKSVDRFEGSLAGYLVLIPRTKVVEPSRAPSLGRHGESFYEGTPSRRILTLEHEGELSPVRYSQLRKTDKDGRPEQ